MRGFGTYRPKRSYSVHAAIEHNKRFWAIKWSSSTRRRLKFAGPPLLSSTIAFKIGGDYGRFY